MFELNMAIVEISLIQYIFSKIYVTVVRSNKDFLIFNFFYLKSILMHQENQKLILKNQLFPDKC